jgi:cell division transport system permease protein
MPWVLAIMMFVSMIVAAAALALANAASLVAGGVQNSYSVELPGGPSEAIAAASVIRQLPGVVNAKPIGEAELRATLERWLGKAADSADLPLPALIDFDISPAGNPEQLAGAISRHIPGGRLTGHRGELAPLLSAMRSLIWLAWGLVLLMAAATASAVVLAAQGALDTHRPTIEVMHGIGATDRQLAHLFQRSIAIDALIGSLAGAGAAALVLLAIIGGRAALIGELTGTAVLGWTDMVLLAVMPVAGTVLAAIVARHAVLRTLQRSL